MSGFSPGAATLYAPHTIRPSRWLGDVAILVYLAMATVIVHVLTGGQYGFQRDELATLEDARRLAWGYVAYPPVTPLFGRISLELFGTSLTGFRFFAADLAGAARLCIGRVSATHSCPRRLPPSSRAINPVSTTATACAIEVNGDFREEIGWPELVETVAHIRDSLSAEDRAHLGILTSNYGEAGAVNLYGPQYGLPRAISGVNSFWEQGYGNPPPQVVIVLGMSRESVEKKFAACQLSAQSWNRFRVQNEETVEHPAIFVCRGLIQSWPNFWKNSRHFG